MYEPYRFAEKYQLAKESAIQEKPDNGLCGFELEWNMLDKSMRPVFTVGSGPQRQSFVDFLRDDVLSPWAHEYQPARGISLDGRVGDTPILFSSGGR